jgi:hydrogenase nickel incorporation protein HypB
MPRQDRLVEGDQATETDAARIRAAGCIAVQINTGTGCHLDADMLRRGLAALKPPRESVVIIENVGNLVCPALFDRGEQAKVVVLSVTEGDDKPLKYPHMFRAAEVMIITKSDLLAHVEFSVERCLGNARAFNRSIRSFMLSATTGEGVGAWYDWLNAKRSAALIDADQIPGSAEIAG